MTTITLRRLGLMALDQLFRHGPLIATAALIGVGVYVRTQVQMPPLAGEWTPEMVAQCQAAVKLSLATVWDKALSGFTLVWLGLALGATGGNWRGAVTACAPLLVLWVGLGLVLWAW